MALPSALLLHKRLTITEALRIVRQIADALGAAHMINVIHRDIKPENVFVLPPDNKVKVLDFGIAKFAGLGLTTNKYRFHGTPVYMSPEHLRDGTVTVRSDIYQLLVVAFEMITGVNPCLVDLDSPQFEQIAYRQIQRPTPPLVTLISDPPPAVEYLIQKGTAKDPAKRFGSMAELILALDQALKERASTHPQEARRVRFVDAATIRAAEALRPDDYVDPVDSEPIESADTEAAAPPTFDSAVDPARTKAGPPGPLELASIARQSSPRVEPLPPIGVPGPTRVGRAPKTLAPTVEISRRQSEQYHRQIAVPSTPRPPPTSPRMVQQPAASVRVPETNDALTTSSVNRHPPRPITPMFLATAVVFGAVAGLSLSWPKIQEARQRHLIQVQHLGATVTGSSPEAIAPVASTPPDVTPASSPAPAMLAVVPATSTATAPSKPKKATSKIHNDTTGEKAINAPPIDVDAPKPRTPLVLDPWTKPAAPTNEDLAKVQARAKEFKADMERQAREAKKAREAKQ